MVVEDIHVTQNVRRVRVLVCMGDSLCATTILAFGNKLCYR